MTTFTIEPPPLQKAEIDLPSLTSTAVTQNADAFVFHQKDLMGGWSIEWSHYPKSDAPSELTRKVVRVFEEAAPQIDSEHHKLGSNQVLAHVADGLSALGFQVETGKKKAEKIQVPVLFGSQGKVEKSFEADAYHPKAGFVLEVEAGRGVVNNQFLKDLFQACMTKDVEYLPIAVRRLYEGGGQRSKDYERVVTLFDTLYASSRLQLPLRGVVVIGY